MKKAIVSVINDLVTDQRVHKTCMLLEEVGFEVQLVGRRRRKSPPMPDRGYRTHRMKLLFETGPFFYAEYNIRLFFFLLFRKADLLFSNDLDTLMPNYLVGRLKNTHLVYDSHELFTETPEVIHRKFVQSVWLSIERSILPKLSDVITVSDSIANIFSERYGIEVTVVRNIPPTPKINPATTRKTLGLPIDKKILLLQGAGINIHRGAEELVESMQYLEDTLLLIIGGGDVITDLKTKCTDLMLGDRIKFIPRLPMEQLIDYTRNADLGLSIDKDTNLNYRYSLPNKLFDYIHAGIPVCVSPLVEVRKIVLEYDIGIVLRNHDPKEIAKTVKSAFSDPKQLGKWKENAKFAASELNWALEKQKLKHILEKYA